MCFVTIFNVNVVPRLSYLVFLPYICISSKVGGGYRYGIKLHNIVHDMSVAISEKIIEHARKHDEFCAQAHGE